MRSSGQYIRARVQEQQTCVPTTTAMTQRMNGAEQRSTSRIHYIATVQAGRQSFGDTQSSAATPLQGACMIEAKGWCVGSGTLSALPIGTQDRAEAEGAASRIDLSGKMRSTDLQTTMRLCQRQTH